MQSECITPKDKKFEIKSFQKEIVTNMSETKKCYIRRKNSQWQEARSHHERALQLYVTTYVDSLGPGTMPPTAIISTDHEDGGIFSAHFSRPNEYHYEFVDEYHNIVSIMMADLSFVDYINRITN